jgi:hypothetical protein
MQIFHIPFPVLVTCSFAFIIKIRLLRDIFNLLQQEAHGTQGVCTEQQGQTELLGQVGESPLLIVLIKKNFLELSHC